VSDRLFSPRFFIMFGFSFTVFVSVFQLLPTAPYRVLALGGSTAVAGLFHGFLTFASAASAPFAGAISDRIGHRRVLIGVSLLLAMFTGSYSIISSYQVMLAVVVAHGLIWSALLSASGAYMTATIPPSRRGEGLGYWGLASVLAIGAAPALGFWVYRRRPRLARQRAACGSRRRAARASNGASWRCRSERHSSRSGTAG
jgi:MFS family permease